MEGKIGDLRVYVMVEQSFFRNIERSSNLFAGENYSSTFLNQVVYGEYIVY